MPSYFPPTPKYPYDYDDDHSLFLVYNTTETTTTADVDAWAEEIPVRPRRADQGEIWPSNGYATIAGELFYYDAVQTNSSGKVCRLKRCLRNVGGNPTEFNGTGTWVRGFVVAEHHTQLVNATLLIENFVGENFSTNPATLDWRIRHLAQSPIISDDACPACQFDFNIISTSIVSGTVANYELSIQGGGSAKLSFGDGTSTTHPGAGTHTYAPGATIDPILTVDTAQCKVVQSPITRTTTTTTPSQISTVLTPPFVVPVPIPPPIPPFTIPNISVMPPELNLPPINFPQPQQPGGGGGGGGGPSQIQIPSSIQLIGPSFIALRGPDNIPSVIDVVGIPKKIELEGASAIPSRIFGPDINIPSRIRVEGFNADRIPSVIDVKGLKELPSIISVVGCCTWPSVIDLKMPSAIDVHATVEARVAASTLFVEVVGPSTITLQHDLQQGIKIQPFPKLTFHEDDMAKLAGGFRLLPPAPEDMKISVVPFKSTMKFQEKHLERLEKLSVPIKMPEQLPELLVKFPDPPIIKVAWPDEAPTIKVEVPDGTRIPMFYEGPPLPVEPVKINLTIQNLAGQAMSDITCVAIVPCGK